MQDGAFTILLSSNALSSVCECYQKPYLLIFVVQENEIVISVIRDLPFNPFVYRVRDPQYDPLEVLLVIPCYRNRDKL